MKNMNLFGAIRFKKWSAVRRGIGSKVAGRFVKYIQHRKDLSQVYIIASRCWYPFAIVKDAFYVLGSFATASCTRCKYQVKADDIREDIFAQRIPLCPKCRVNALPPILEINPNESYRGNSKDNII